MTSISTSRQPFDPGDSHVRVSVFVGPDHEHRALAGVLTFRRGEDDEFIRRVEDMYQRTDNIPIDLPPTGGGPVPTPFDNSPGGTP